jgi:FkbM family methyltransferase
MVVREALQWRNYLALWGMWRRYPHFLDNAGRYFLARGTLPYACEVRTPCGLIAPTLYSPDDMWTVNEVFCREDYAARDDLGVVVDIGSNIGISALYFLTRNAYSRCWLYEPVPRNVERLRRNLAGYEDRYTLRQVAVAPAPGASSFGVEESGRYGGIGVDTGQTIEVECLGVNDVLDEVLGSAGAIDVLKIDTEGSELDLFRAIRSDILERVETVYLEVERRPVLDVPFHATFRNQTWALRSDRQRRGHAPRRRVPPA